MGLRRPADLHPIFHGRGLVSPTARKGGGQAGQEAGTTTSFLFDGGSVLLEKQGATTTATYTYGNALFRKNGETPLFDGLGSERTVTGSTGSVTASLTLSAFGQTIASSGSSTSAYQYGATSGYRSEGDAGLTLVGCRYYDAQVGRFITRDTYLDEAPYAYCDGDPINGVDPSGHVPIWLQRIDAIWRIALTLVTGHGPGSNKPPYVAPPPPAQTSSSGGTPPPDEDPGGDEGGGGGNVGGVITTVATGVMVGGTGVIETLKYRNKIRAYEFDPSDPDKDPTGT